MTAWQGVVMSIVFVSGLALGTWFGAVLWRRESKEQRPKSSQ